MYSDHSPGWEGENGLLPISMKKKSMYGQSAVTPPCRGSRREAATCGAVKRRGIRDVEKSNRMLHVTFCPRAQIPQSRRHCAPLRQLPQSMVILWLVHRSGATHASAAAALGYRALKLQLSKLYSHTSKGHATGVPLTVQIFICKLFAISVNFE